MYATDFCFLADDLRLLLNLLLSSPWIWSVKNKTNVEKFYVRVTYFIGSSVALFLTSVSLTRFLKCCTSRDEASKIGGLSNRKRCSHFHSSR